MTYQFFKTIDLVIPVKNLGWQSNSALATTPVLIDLNKDGQLDFVFHLFQLQSSANWGTVTSAATPNNLLVFLSQSDGSYAERSINLFLGELSTSLPGMSRKVSIADLNQDGWLDWVYALNREDGRSGNPSVNSTSQAAAVLSNGDGTYRIEEFGAPNWYHSVYIDNLIEKTPVVIVSGYYTGPSFGGEKEGYQLGGGYQYSWSSASKSFITGSPVPTHANTFLTFLSPTGATQILSVVNSTTGVQQLGLFELKNNLWVLQDKIQPYKSSFANFVSYSQDKGTAELFLLQPGVYGVAAGYSESKSISLYPGDNSTAVFKLSAAQISAPRSDGYYYQNDGQNFQKLDFYRTNGSELKQLTITVINEDRAVNSNFMDVIDLNKDGLQDVVVYPYISGGQPRVYLNTGGNVFLKLSDDLFPKAPIQWGSSASSKFADINGDGVWDLLYAPMNGFSTFDSSQLEWLTYLGDKNFDSSGLKQNLQITDRLGSTKINAFGGNDVVSDLGYSTNYSSIDTGAGIDLVAYSNKKSEYTINEINNNWNVTSRQANGINDSLRNVERIKFSDISVALDLTGNAGTTAKILGAVFGKQAVTNKSYLGVGLSFLDAGWTYDNLAALALEAAGAKTNDQIVSLLWANVIGTKPAEADKQPFIALLENGMTAGALAHLAADTSFNTTNINLVGLAQTGIEYIPVG